MNMVFRNMQELCAVICLPLSLKWLCLSYIHILSLEDVDVHFTAPFLEGLIVNYLRGPTDSFLRWISQTSGNSLRRFHLDVALYKDVLTDALNALMYNHKYSLLDITLKLNMAYITKGKSPPCETLPLSTD